MDTAYSLIQEFNVNLLFNMTRTMEHRTIRKVSLPADAERVMEVFAAGKAIMVKSGNLNQWINGYPSLEVVQSDMEKGGGFVIEDSGKIVAYFAFLPSSLSLPFP